MAFPAYRIEHHRGDDPRLILAFCDDARRPQTTLAPYAERLLEEGETGAVVLIDQATEEVVARRHLVDLRFPDLR